MPLVIGDGSISPQRTINSTNPISPVSPTSSISPRSGLTKNELEVLREVKSSLLLPLSLKGGVVGIVSLGPRLGDLPYSREDEGLLMSVAGQATFAIENALLVEQM